MQVFCSHYLQDADPRNGCLRVISGSHVYRHPIHDLLLTHDDVPDALPDDHSMLQDALSAVDVPAKAGSLVIADARVLHAAHANRTDQHRALLLGWYLLDVHRLRGALREQYADGYGRHTFSPPDWWAGAAGDAVKPPVVDPPTGGPKAARNRQPGECLRRPSA